MDAITRAIATALAADPGALDAMRHMLARLPPLGDAPYASAVWRERCLRLLREGEALSGVRTALVVHAAGNAPAMIEGYGPLLAWGTDRANWRQVARLLASHENLSAGGWGQPAR
jgi:hypothetical protein